MRKKAEAHSSSKHALCKARIDLINVKLESYDNIISNLESKLSNISPSSERFPISSFNELCSNYDERDYLNYEKNRFVKILEIIENKDQNCLLPRTRVRLITTRDQDMKPRSSSTSKSPMSSKLAASSEQNESTSASTVQSQVHIASSSKSVEKVAIPHDQSAKVTLSSSEEDDPKDEDFVIDFYDTDSEGNTSKKPKAKKKKTESRKNLKKQSSPKPQKRKSRKRKSRKQYVAKDINEISKKCSSKYLLSKSDDEYDSDSSTDDISNAEPQRKHSWVFNLREEDNEDESFSSKYLTVIRGNTSKISKLSWHELTSTAQKQFSSNVDSVIFIQRGLTSQMYILSGLQNSLHFTLGSIGYSKLLKFCQSLQDVLCYTYTNQQSIASEKFFLNNFSQSTSQPTTSIPTSMETKYTNMMIELSKFFLPTLVTSFQPDTGRAKHVINLGITNMKVHQHKRLSITGRQGLSLISPWSKSMQIGNSALSYLGSFLMFLVKEVIPRTGFSQMFNHKHDCEKEYLQLFARQLNINNNDDINLFNIPAVSLLINHNLNPHYDTLNPTSNEVDKTLSITVKVPLTALPPKLKNILEEKHSIFVPFCIVLYRRQCLETLHQYHTKIDLYQSKEHFSHVVRDKLITILSDGVYSAYDYGGLFFTKHRQRLIEHKFEPMNNFIFKDKICVLDEAVDKCGFWSCLLHMFYVFAYIRGLRRNDILSFVLFFGHQCNTTVVVMQAMIDLLRIPTLYQDEKSLYSNLVAQCKNIKGTTKDVDVGCGPFNRFSPSNTRSFNDERANEICKQLNNWFGTATHRIQKIQSSKKLCPVDVFECYQELSNNLSKIDGVKFLRASHIIQLSSLLGLIPLQYYVYLPVHSGGGTGDFFCNEFGYTYSKDNTTIFQKYINELSSLQGIYGQNFTSNMFENLACILGRGKPRKDIYYFLPWICKDSDCNPVIDQVTHVQLTFYIKVQDINNISLVCKSNSKESIVISTQKTTTDPSDNLISFNKVIYRNASTKQDVLVLAESGHFINHSWMESQYEILEPRHLNNFSIFKQTQLPLFESFYTTVSVFQYLI